MVMYCDICGAKIENGDKFTECPECLCPFENVDKLSPIKEYKSKVPHGGIIKKISTDESFMNAMVKLYETDPIEYQLKIQQFKTRIQEQKAFEEKQQESKKPHCPTCGSTDIVKLSFWAQMSDMTPWGGVMKYFGCNNCGYKW